MVSEEDRAAIDRVLAAEDLPIPKLTPERVRAHLEAVERARWDR